MRHRTIGFGYYILIFVFCCNTPFQLIFTLAEDGGEITTGSAPSSAATIVISENVSSSSSSEEKDTTKLKGDEIVDNSDSVLEPSVDSNDNIKTFQNQVFTDVASQNSGVASNFEPGGQPIIITLADTATAELQQRADIPKETSQSKENVVQNKTEDIKPPVELQQEHPTTEEIRSEPILNDTAFENKSSNATDEDIPSFSEWTQKRLEEAEKEQVNSSDKGPSANGKQGSGAKLRWKNYASLDCGAKVIAANPESVSPGAILSPSRDEYKLNACTNRIWFIVELCESIEMTKIDLANYELFSSSPKDFTVSISDRFPSREWSSVGQFTAKDEKDLQSFDLDPQIFGKYIKVEIKSHYGSEHYCPISLFRVYGTSVFEVLQKEDPGHVNRAEEDDDDDENLDEENGDTSKNLFSSATDAVISIVKKAAEVLGNKPNYTNETVQQKNKSTVVYSPLIHVCSTPSHLVVCDNCTESLFGEVYQLVSCRSIQIENFIAINFIRKSLLYSDICQRFGFDLRPKNSNVTVYSSSSCLKSFFPEKYLGAMCNFVAIAENKVVLNNSHQYNNVTTDKVSIDDTIIDIDTSEPHSIQTDKLEVVTSEKSEVQPTDPLVLENTDVIGSKSSCSTDISYTSQIKPTKALSSEIEFIPSDLNVHTENPKIIPSETLTEQSSESPEKNSEIPVIEPIVTESSGDIDQEVESTPESVETLDDHLDNIINELNGETTTNTANTATAATPAQKESVFLRLSNRIKALERNMSLSSQYLEELSKRYKKQVEEMQRLLEKTVSTLNEENKKKDEINKQLEERLNNLTDVVETLLSERSILSSALYWLFFVAVFSVVLFSYCFRKSTSKPPTKPETEIIEILRRKSIDVISHNQPSKKKRRPSDQALKIVRASLQCEQQEKRFQKDRRKRKKKVSLRRSNSINTLSEENDYYSGSEKLFRPQRIRNDSDWIEGNKAKDVVEAPFVLEDSEHSTLEAIPLQDELSRIEVPSYIQTAVNIRLNRASSHNGSADGKIVVPRKSTSLDETKRGVSPVLSVNGNASISSTDDMPKKEKKGFKKLLKKVF